LTHLPLLSVLRSFQPWARPRSSSRREAILEATIRVVGSSGFRRASLDEIAAEAGISPATVQRCFEDKHECFLAAYDLLAERLFLDVERGCEADLEWSERVETGLARLLDRFAADAALARTAIVEVAAVGPEARRRHWEALVRFGRFLEGGRALAAGRELPEQISVMAVGAVSGLVFEELRAGRAEALPAMLPDLLFAMLVPFVGPSVAAGEMRRAAEAIA
jgi:AcrR family transcriptional regulator